RDGKFSSYHDNGNLEYEGCFEDGKRIGCWRFYNNDGGLSKEQNYKNGNELK
ncbi:MAG: hypothetical protein ACKVHG_10270, partial [Sphingomonadales bacterium]